jgi:pimeloyl-ACP methyl ester carboxylesterase
MSALHVVPEVVPDADHATGPTLVRQALEVRAGLDWVATRLSGNLVDRWPTGDGHPVLVLPGFLANEMSTHHLRATLRRLGYWAHDWKLGRNLGLRPGVQEQIRARVEQVAEQHGRPMSIIGWSLGGIFAREIARQSPDHVRQVITLGSPFRGNHTASRAWRTYVALNRRNLHLSPMGEAARVARARPLDLPTTCIYSKRDGIVAWECCTSLPAPLTENIEVDSTHLGFGHHLETLYVIADRLAQAEGAWRPFERTSPAGGRPGVA